MTQVYATLRRSSKYAHQQRGDEPWPVEFDTASDSHADPSGHIARGNGNQYRLRDLKFWIKQGETFVELK